MRRLGPARTMCWVLCFCLAFHECHDYEQAWLVSPCFEKTKNLPQAFLLLLTPPVFFCMSINSATALGSVRLLHLPRAVTGADFDMSASTPCGMPRAMIRFLCFARPTSLKKSFNFRLPGTWPTTRRISGSGNKKPNNDSLPRQRANDTNKQFQK